MREHSSFRQGQKKSEERKKLLKTAAIPLIVLILMLVIVIAERGKDAVKSEDIPTAANMEETEEVEGEQESEPMDETEEGNANAEEPIEEEEPILQKDGVPELLSLMKQYYQARATGDAELLNRLYGIEGLSFSALEAEKTRMRSNSKYLRSFDNIVTYVADGLKENEWLVYSTCDMHFHSVASSAPMIMWCYVVQQENGALLIQKPEELSAEVLHHVDVINRSQEVRSLASDINVRLKEVLTADAELNEIYGVLRDGSPVYEENEAQMRKAVQILDESEETSAEQGAASE